MAIKTLQQRLTQVGVIRLGEQRVSKNGKNYPAKLETLRFTSPSKQLIDAVAAAYGGQVKPWGTNTGPQFEVVTGVNDVAVMVPPQKIDPNLEHWGNGFRDRLCDGETELMRQRPCLCAAAHLAGRPFGQRDVCKPTTRMSLMLADIPSLGTWKLESKGWNAAAELPMLAAAIESAPQPIPARLAVEVREKKLFDPAKSGDAAIESRVFTVPVLHFEWVTPAQAFGGELGTAARTALAGANEHRHAIEAAKVESQRRNFTQDDYLAQADDAATVVQVRQVWDDAKTDGSLTDELKAKLTERAATFASAKPAAQPAPAPPAAVPPVDKVVDAEVIPEDDAVWAQILTFAGERGWSAEALERKVQINLNKSCDEADASDLAAFLEHARRAESYLGGVTDGGAR
ncbi:recombination directionality factor [Actinoplanes sp. URMC 104]|uniref:recombination directionality factor n=1 Tax=Actinoplanes sp. URMC 104 TaxID=3423409 RepID=UPI003F1CB365